MWVKWVTVLYTYLQFKAAFQANSSLVIPPWVGALSTSNSVGYFKRSSASVLRFGPNFFSSCICVYTCCCQTDVGEERLWSQSSGNICRECGQQQQQQASQQASDCRGCHLNTEDNRQWRVWGGAAGYLDK